MVRQGWSGGAGSGFQTSPAYPARCPLSGASTRTPVSTMAPRAMLARWAPLFMPKNAWRPNRPSVSGVRDAATTMTSHSSSISFRPGWRSGCRGTVLRWCRGGPLRGLPEVDVVGTHTGGQDELEVGGLVEHLSVRGDGPERRRYEHVRIAQA